jgi:hypothetical protein
MGPGQIAIRQMAVLSQTAQIVVRSTSRTNVKESVLHLSGGNRSALPRFNPFRLLANPIHPKQNRDLENEALCQPKYGGALPGFHLMLQPILGF